MPICKWCGEVQPLNLGTVKYFERDFICKKCSMSPNELGKVLAQEALDKSNIGGQTMNLNKLMPIQKRLDDHIKDEQNLHGQDLLDKKILSLQVELGELANEWRGFKFWKVDPKPRTKVICNQCSGDGKGFFSGKTWTGKKEICITCGGTGKLNHKNPLLEEYVDCLHFILSIGLDKNFTHMIFEPVKDQDKDITFQFNQLFKKIGDFHMYQTTGNFIAIKSLFVGLGEMLGFTWEQIEQAYLDKNKVNHERQENGY
ncbi:dUTP diphosphatase [Virgibacillus salexigens]|uniref:Uncharacterized protein n=1 Tax=Virgibacillus kapii TaxID=1638645 RepID=A0ABQ2DP94_9BACI|nr:dUTP diphosphatase [Virgibacillus kapii]GGJ61895.1 hypothetical protein GCM10007111_24970 [Virgibacillus kapii]